MDLPHDFRTQSVVNQTFLSEDDGLFLGLMSGTSVDGIDVVLATFKPQPKLLCGRTFSIPTTLTAEILRVSQSSSTITLDELGTLDTQLGEAFAAAICTLLKENNIDPITVRAIGSHGQTLRHRPSGDAPFTMQIGDPHIIAERTGITTVADFRRRDVAAGGQGAPLVPAFHANVFSANENRAILNIGGIANVTLLAADGGVRGFDTGPGNGLMDAWCQRHWHIAYDEGGQKARMGDINTELLERLLADPWLQLPSPKSTGRDYFHLEWLDYHLQGLHLNAESVLCTLNAFTTHSILNAISQHGFVPETLFVCGGGVHNALLMDNLRTHLPCPVHSTAKLGVDPDYVEAMAFAWLAKQCLDGKPGNVVDVTGAVGPRILGAIYPC